MFALDIAEKIQMTLLQEQEGFFGNVVAFCVFLPNGEKTDGGRGDMKDRLGKHVPHNAELEQLGGITVYICPPVQHDTEAFLGRQESGDRRPVNTF
jgi:hypothetical protein